MLIATNGFILPDLKCAESMIFPIIGSANELMILDTRIITAHFVRSAARTLV